MKDTLKKLNSVFPGSKVLDDNGLEQEETHRQLLQCNYGRRLRTVDKDVCRFHLETFDPFCWKDCACEWTIKRLRPALEEGWNQHKDHVISKVRYTPQNLWGDNNVMRITGDNTQ